MNLFFPHSHSRVFCPFVIQKNGYQTVFVLKKWPLNIYVFDAFTVSNSLTQSVRDVTFFYILAYNSRIAFYKNVYNIQHIYVGFKTICYYKRFCVKCLFVKKNTFLCHNADSFSCPSVFLYVNLFV